MICEIEIRPILHLTPTDELMMDYITKSPSAALVRYHPLGKVPFNELLKRYLEFSLQDHIQQCTFPERAE